MPFSLDAKICFDEHHPLPEEFSEPSDPFEPNSWGSHFQNMKGLQVLQMELETMESRKEDLEIIVDRAKGWKIPLGDGKVLILDESKIKRTGWVGLMLGKSTLSGEILQPSDSSR